jgi:hypothetical protein
LTELIIYKKERMIFMEDTQNTQETTVDNREKMNEVVKQTLENGKKDAEGILG